MDAITGENCGSCPVEPFKNERSSSHILNTGSLSSEPEINRSLSREVTFECVELPTCYCLRGWDYHSAMTLALMQRQNCLIYVSAETGVICLETHVIK